MLYTHTHTHTHTPLSEIPNSNPRSTPYFRTHLFLAIYSYHTNIGFSPSECYSIYGPQQSILVKVPAGNRCHSQLGCLKRCFIEDLFTEVWARVKGTVLFWVLCEEDAKTRLNLQGFFRGNIYEGKKWVGVQIKLEEQSDHDASLILKEGQRNRMLGRSILKDDTIWGNFRSPPANVGHQRILCLPRTDLPYYSCDTHSLTGSSPWEVEPQCKCGGRLYN